MTSTVYEHFPTLTGRQQPHFLSRQNGSSDHGSKASKLAERMGSRPMPWQVDSLDAILAKNEDGSWTHPDCCILCPRQNGKSLILTLRIIYGLLVLGETIIFTAQRWTTAEDIYKRALALLMSRPSLSARIANKTCSQGRGIIETTNGAKVVFTTRSQDSGKGLTKLDLVIYDESYNLTEGEMTALAPTQLAALDPQTIYASSPVDQEKDANGNVLAAIRKRGYEREEELYLAEFMAPPEMDRESEDTWRYANPSYGVIQTAKKIRKLMRGFSTAKGRKSFDVDMLGRGDWPVDEEAVEIEHIIDLDEWDGLLDPAPVFEGPVCLAVDMSPDRKLVAIAAAQRTSAGKVHLEVGYFSAPGTGLVPMLVRLVDRAGACALVIDRQSPAKSLLVPLEQAGIEAEATTAGQYAEACGGWYDDVEAAGISHNGDPLIHDAIESAGWRDLAGSRVFDRRGMHSIAPLVAITEAHYGLMAFGGRVVVPPASPAVDEVADVVEELDIMAAF